MNDFEIVDDFVRRAAELRQMAATASRYAAPLLLDLASRYDELTTTVRERGTAH